MLDQTLVQIFVIVAIIQASGYLSLEPTWRRVLWKVDSTTSESVLMVSLTVESFSCLDTEAPEREAGVGSCTRPPLLRLRGGGDLRNGDIE